MVQFALEKTSGGLAIWNRESRGKRRQLSKAALAGLDRLEEKNKL